MVFFKSFLILAICVHQAWSASNTTYINSSVPGYKITIVDLNSGVPDSTVTGLRQRFWATYSTMANAYNPNAMKIVKFTFDPNLQADVPAYANGEGITFSAEHLLNNPNDLDVVVHEGFHLIQQGFDECSGYLIEGLADFVRNKYGQSNAATGWSLPTYSVRNYFKNGYGEMAVLVKYLEENGYSNASKNLFNACKVGNGYNDDEDQAWRNLFGGKSPADHWEAYAKKSLAGKCF